MPLPPEPCFELAIDISAFLDLNVLLPGGVSLTAKLEAGEFPSLQGITASILGELNAAMTPLMPFFNLLDVVIKIIEFCQAIPDALGPPPDPTSVVVKLEALLKAAAKLNGLFPPISIPIMIVGICKVITAALYTLIDELESIIDATVSLDLARERADALAANPLLLEGAAMLRASIDCAQADLDLKLSVSASSLGPLNKFIDLLNALAGLAGLPELVKIEAGADMDGLLQPLRDFVLILDTFCGAIPV